MSRDRSTSLGPGWTHNFAIRVRCTGDETSDLFFVRPNGQTDRYTANPGGSYSPPPGVQATLVANEFPSYTLTTVDQTVQQFDSAGNLTSITDRYGNETVLTYNDDGQLVSISDPAGRGVLTLAYDAVTGLLTSVTDWIDRVVEYGYDTLGCLETVTDREGKVTTYAYDGTTHRLTTITDANGHVAITMTYDAEGRVATQQDAMGLITGEMTTLAYVTNPDGTQTTTVAYPSTSLEPTYHPLQVDTYNTDGWVTQHVMKPTSNSTDDVVNLYTYDANGFRDSVVDGRGNLWQFCYDVDYAGMPIAGSRGNLTRLATPPSGLSGALVTLYQYDAKSNLVQVVPPKGIVPPPGTLTAQLATSISKLGSIGLGGTVTAPPPPLPPFCEQSFTIDPAYATDLAYDAATQSKLVSITRQYTDPELGTQTATTKLEYDDPANPGAVTKIIPPRGNTGPTPDYSFATTLVYFDSGSQTGLLLSATDALGNQTTYEYDAVGRRISTVDPNGNASWGVPADHTWTTEYDAEDRVRFIHAPAPTSGGSTLTTEFRYDNVGNQTLVIDANGQVTLYGYDERDGLTQVQQSPDEWTDPEDPPPNVISAQYQFDNAGNLSRVTRAAGDAANERVTDYVYDGLNRLIQETQYPAWPAVTPTLVTSYAYDQNGNPKSLEDPLGQTTTYTFDAIGRLTNVQYSDAGTPDVSYEYDANGNRTQMEDGTGTTTYEVDELDRLLAVTSPGAVSVGYRYDLDGNRLKLIYPDDTAVSYVFDKASRLERLVDWANRVTSYAYQPDGSVVTAMAPNGTATQFRYDNAARLTRVWNQGKGSAFAGQLGSPEAILADLQLGVGAAAHGSTISRHTYTLDNVGNRTQVDEALPVLGPPSPISSISTTSYDYDQLYRLTGATDPDVSTAYTYDPVGNRLTMVRGSSTAYTYDRADRILTAGATPYVVNANGNTTGRGADTFGYDQANRLASAMVGLVASGYSYDGDGKRASKTVAAATTSYLYDVNRSLPVVLDDGTRKYVWGLGLAYAVDKISGAILAYHTDGLASVRGVTDAAGNVIETYQNDEFGVAVTTAGSVDQPFQYTGEQRDAESGFIYLRARMYEPALGRLAQRDPLVGRLDLPLSLNRYAYALANPATLADHSGLAASRALLEQCQVPSRDRPAEARNTRDFAAAINSLAQNYARRVEALEYSASGAKDAFVSAVGYCFANIPRDERRVWLIGIFPPTGLRVRFVDQSDLMRDFRDRRPGQDQSHHWAAYFWAGYYNYDQAVFGANRDTDPGDKALGLLAAGQGRDFRNGTLDLATLAPTVLDSLFYRGDPWGPH